MPISIDIYKFSEKTNFLSARLDPNNHKKKLAYIMQAEKSF